MRVVNGQESLFIGGWVSPQQKARFEALAQLRGKNQNALLKEIIDGLTVPSVRVHLDSASQDRDPVAA